MSPARSTVRPWCPPSRFDGFEITRPIGVGGMGVVYLARDTQLDRAVALKIVAHPERDRHAVDRFAIEARALARVHHPNVVVAYRAGKVDHRPYLAQELLVGDRLDEVPRPAPWRQVLRWGHELACAVAAAHARGVIHRDIKPGNIMLVGGRRLKLFDFGLAHIVEGARLDSEGDGARPPAVPDLERPRLTAYGSIAGTPAYLAPELWEGGTPTVRSDGYAVGLTMYELLAGALPHGQLHGLALVQASRTHDVPPLAASRPDVPAALADLIDRCVARDPAARPASVAAIRDALDALDAAHASGAHAWAVDDELDAMPAHALDPRPTARAALAPPARTSALTRPGRTSAVRRRSAG